MKFSKFNVVMSENGGNSHSEIPLGSVLIYNTLSKATYLFSENQYNSLVKYIQSGDELCVDIELDDLKEDMIVVGKCINEDLLFEHWYNQIKYNDKELNLIIAPTTACNLRCTYCFEEGIPIIKMGRRLLTDLVSFLEKNYDLTAYKKVNVTLYGGEPLMYPHLTKEIMETLNLLFDRCEVTSDYRMITNGTLLNAQIAQDLVERGLRLIQVTIDGPQRYHDARRFYPDGAGSFETIIKNLQQYIDIIPYVALRISLDKQNCNFKEMDQFLVRLNELDLKDKLSELYFACIVETLGENQHGSSYAFDYAEAGKILCTFSELLKRHGICSLEDPNFSPCRAHSNGGVVINADGELYKCISLIGRKEYSVGHISTGFNENYIPFLNINKWRSCLKENCPFVPLCAGGCHFDSVVGYGDINLKTCRKGMVESFWLDSIVSNIFSESE